MWSNVSKNFAKSGFKLIAPTVSVPVIPTSTASAKLGHREAEDKKYLGRHERISAVLNRVRERDGLPLTPSFVDQIVGKTANGLPGLNLGDKTNQILQTNHPVKSVLEREICQKSQPHATYYDWLILFGRGIRTKEAPKYEENLHLISLAANSGMTSSRIHQTMIDIPDDYTARSAYLKYHLGNKYAALVGDFFAIRCIFYMEKVKHCKAFIAMTKGLEQFTKASFAVNFLDSRLVYPHLPHPDASVEEWINYNRKSSGYFTGGLYAALIYNYDGFPQDTKLTNRMSRFSANLSVLLKGAADVEMFENLDHSSGVPIDFAISLPAVLFQQKHPGIFSELRKNSLNLHADFRQIAKEIQQSSAPDEAKFILRKLANDAITDFQSLAKDEYYTDAVQELIASLSYMK